MWQYRVVTLQTTEDAGLQNTLNEFGREGWELVSVTEADPRWFTFFFKKLGRPA